jgi:hypothetical protein
MECKAFTPVVKIGTPPPPNLQASVLSLVPGGGAHSLAGEGVGRSQFQREDIHCGTLGITPTCTDCPRTNCPCSCPPVVRPHSQSSRDQSSLQCMAVPKNGIHERRQMIHMAAMFESRPAVVADLLSSNQDISHKL